MNPSYDQSRPRENKGRCDDSQTLDECKKMNFDNQVKVSFCSKLFISYRWQF